MKQDPYKIIVIGASFGGIDALNYLIPQLRKISFLPIVVVQHIKPSTNSYLAESLNSHCEGLVKEAKERDSIESNTVYIAPGGYHLYIEKDQRFSLSLDSAVQYSRPSIDVLFESAVYAYGKYVIAILLTGANSDGAEGMLAIHNQGGMTIVQDPNEAVMPTMPQSAIDLFSVDIIAPLSEIPAHLSLRLNQGHVASRGEQ